MTADKLQAAVRVLANGCWCRYWMDYGRAKEGHAIMAIQCRDESGKPLEIRDAVQHGFSEGEGYFYTATRTNEDGSPYSSKL